MGGHAESSFAAHVRAWGVDDRRQGRAQGWLDRAEAARHEELVDGLADLVAPRPEVLVHGDCSPQHWLIDPSDGAIGVIDLGDAGLGDPAYDLVVLTLTQPHRWETVLDGYGADPGVRAHLDAARSGYLALRLAGEVRWLVDHSFDPGPARARLAAALC
jgi:aminoglycoside phosphotransferase (APT) family kinase protein